MAILLAAVLPAMACTSSSTSASGYQTNAGYDSQYSQSARSSQSSYGGQQPSTEAEGDPPITVMLVSMETGDVYPGEDYYVYTVVDNPKNMDLEYVWSVAAGDVREVPEAERGRLQALVEDEYKNASATPAPAAQTETPPAAGETTPTAPAGTAAPAGAAAAGAASGGSTAIGGGAAPTPGAAAPTGAAPAAPAGAAPAPTGAAAPESGSTTGTSTEDPFAQQGGGGGSTTGASGSTGSTSTGGSEQTGSGEWQPDPSLPADIQEILIKRNRGEELTPAEEQRLAEHAEENKPSTGGGSPSTGTGTGAGGTGVGMILERRMVAAPTSDSTDQDKKEAGTGSTEPGTDDTKSEDNEETTDDDPAAAGGGWLDVAGEVADDLEEEAGNIGEEDDEATCPPVTGNDWYIPRADDEERDEPVSAAGNVGEAPTVSTASPDYRREYSSSAGGSLRSEYSVWQNNNGETRRSALGEYGTANESEPLSEEESFELSSVTTDEPYILWTPRVPGEVKIFVKAAYKGEDMTEPREMAVTVRLREPEVTLSDEFPDIVREDEPLYVRIDGANLPSFYKGLFTVMFDATKLSMREAELGDFFDDAPGASIYYAQPSKTDGRVLLAIDSNTEISDLSGDGSLVYLKFKAKEDLFDQATTQLALVMDTSARYILNTEGENVLPLPADRPAYRTSTIMPPELPQYEREQTPGTAAGGQQAGAQATTGGQQAPASSGGQTPTSGAPAGAGLPGSTQGLSVPQGTTPTSEQLRQEEERRREEEALLAEQPREMMSAEREDSGISETSSEIYGPVLDEETAQTIVYIVPEGDAEGKHYHRENCSIIAEREDVEAVTIEEALAMGYTACQRCNPPAPPELPEPESEE